MAHGFPGGFIVRIFFCGNTLFIFNPNMRNKMLFVVKIDIEKTLNLSSHTHIYIYIYLSHISVPEKNPGNSRSFQ